MLIIRFIAIRMMHDRQRWKSSAKHAFDNRSRAGLSVQIPSNWVRLLAVTPTDV